MAEKVQIDLVAQDKASKTIDAVATDVEALEKADPEIAITADDNATRTIDELATTAGELDKLDPTVTIAAADHASDDISAIRTDANDLTDRDREIVLKARVDSAKADLASLQGELRTTTEKAEETSRTLDRVDSGGSNLRGNAIADLTGPLGEASGAASDFAGVFDGLGDIAEGVVGKLGGSSEMAGKVSSALGGLGVAVAAGAAIWSMWSAKQEEARQKAEETRKAYIGLQKALAEGDLRKAAEDFLKLNQGAIDAGKAMGSTAEETANLIDGIGNIDGKTASAVGTLEEMRRQMEESGKTSIEMGGDFDTVKRKLEDQVGAILDAKQTWGEQHGVYADSKSDLEDVTLALGNHVTGLGDSMKAQDLQRVAIEKANTEVRKSKEAVGDAAESQRDFARDLGAAEAKTDSLHDALDRLRDGLNQADTIRHFEEDFLTAIANVQTGVGNTGDDISGLKTDILDVAEFAGLNPVQVKALMDAVDDGDIAGVLALTQAELDKEENKVRIQSKIDRPGQIGGGSAGGQGGAGPRSAGPEVGTINMHLPAGWRGDPMRTVHAARRRTGRLFAR